MATKCLFKIFYKIYLFPHRPQKKGKLKGLYIDGDQVSFQNTLPNLFVSTQVTKERKNERLSLSVFFEIYLLPDRSAHFLYVQGLDAKGSKIPVTDHLQRSACLSRLTDMWLSTWGEEEENVE